MHTRLQLYAHRRFLVFNDERFTYAQVYQESVRIAAWLQQAFQVRKGDRGAWLEGREWRGRLGTASLSSCRIGVDSMLTLAPLFACRLVGIAARNYPEFVASYWAIALVGGVACPLNSFHDGDTLAFSIRDVSCRVVIVDGERYERLVSHMDGLFDPEPPKAISDAARTALSGSTAASSSARATTSIVPHTPVEGMVVLPWVGAKRVQGNSGKPWMKAGTRKGIFDYEQLMETVRDVKDAPNVDVQPEDFATILFTSGTTGKPKGVLSTQRQSLSCLRLATYGGARNLLRRRRQLPPPPDPASPDQATLLLLVPLMHTTGLHSGLTLAVASGNCVAMMPQYNRDEAVKLIQREEAVAILGIGFMARELILSGADMPSLQVISHGGSAAAKEIPSEIRKSLPKATTGIGYGLTEVNGVATQNAVDDYYHRPTSVGLPPSGVELAIVDPSTGKEVAQGETGELWIRTPGRAMGYWNRPEDTAAAFLDDGWFRTGDLARFDEDEFLYIVDRVKDIIVRGGENISCTQVETGVYSHPSVLHCVAVAVPDERLGEKVGVVCIPHEGTEKLPSEKDIVTAASKVLPRYAVPEFVWVRREPIERNQNGKVLRHVVRKAFIDRIKNQNTSDGPKARL